MLRRVLDNARTVIGYSRRVAAGLAACLAAMAVGGWGSEARGGVSRWSSAIRCVPESKLRGYSPEGGEIRLRVGASLVLALGESEDEEVKSSVVV